MSETVQAAALPAAEGRTDRSTEIAHLVKAIAVARAAFGDVRKNRENPHLKSSYANLIAFIDATAIALAAQGVIVTALPRQSNTNGAWELGTNIMHSSGQWIEGILPLSQVNDPQKFGGIITYMRRYALCAMLNLSADEDDDDGHAATQDARKPAARPAPAAPAGPPIKTFSIIRPGKDPWPRPGADKYVAGWKKLAEGRAAGPHEFDAIVQANLETFDAVCADGGEKIVAEISAIIKAAQEA